ncbi:MAG: extracellular solute-binding protein [Rhodoferax sp.]|nr:extracellular solute-binding protein [Rhodoferax sp.]
MKIRAALFATALALGQANAGWAQNKSLRLLTWADNVPTDVQAMFEKETGYKLELTLSNNEEMISKLRATDGPRFDLAQPSLDRILGAQQELGLYRPIDFSKITTASFIPSILAATKKHSLLDGKIYAVPHIWGTDGLVVNTRLAKISDYGDLCKSEYKGKTAVRLRRSTLLAFAFASGKNPFALYGNPKAYADLMETAGNAIVACKAKLKFWDNRDRLLDSIRNDEIAGALMWDAGGWKLNNERSQIQYVAPRSGALGWVDTFVIPAKGRNDEAAYAWINFNMRPEIAARVAASAGNFTASQGADQWMDAKPKAQFAASYSTAAIDNIKWYPAVPSGLDDIEGLVLERVKAAR